MPSANHTEVGRAGEAAVAAHLVDLGWAVLDRNWHGAHGELDIVAVSGDTVVFVEVKARRGPYLDEAFARVDRRKQAALALTVEDYLEAHGLHDVAWRIDVIAVRLSDGLPEFAHAQDALLW